jgi:flagella basal body P-ring formation protein FlgA
MNRILLALMLTPLALAPLHAAEPDRVEVKVYLPRNVTVAGGTMRLGAVCIVRCDAEALRKKAAAVGLGRSPWAGETITIDRRTVLSRLASSGIPAGAVSLKGAERVQVAGRQKAISPERIVAAAEKRLHADPPGPEGCKWELIGRAEAVVVEGDDLEIEAERIAGDEKNRIPDGRVRVKVSVVAGEEVLAEQTLDFELSYPVRQAVAARTIEAGEMLSSRNLRVVTTLARAPEPEGWKPPYGRAAAVRIPAGAVARPQLTREPTREKVVRRNQIILMKIACAAFTVTAQGQALSDGRPGDLIKVRNTDSKRIVIARVAADGTVEPLVGKEKR